MLSARISPDARVLATTSSDHSTRLWHCAGGLDWSLAFTLQGHQRWVWDSAFSADSSYLVTASTDCTAKLWSVSSGACVRTYSAHSKGVTACALGDEFQEAGGADDAADASADAEADAAQLAGGGGGGGGGGAAP